MSKQLTILSKFASTDETSYNLSHVYAEKSLESLVSTDGHRLASWKTDMHSSRAGEGFNSKVYLKTEEFIWSSDFKYPNVKSFIPDVEKQTLMGPWTIPQWLEKLASVKRGPVPFHFTKLGDVSLTKPRDAEQYAFTINAKLLVPMAGLDVVVHFKDSLSPVSMVCKDLDMVFVIMPLRA